MEVDWAGGTLPITDPVTGIVDPAYLFVAVLPCSCYPYVELCGDMKQENWLLCHVHTFEYYDGVPRLLIPDNLKTGVTKNTRLDTIPLSTAVMQNSRITMALQSFPPE